MSGWVWCSGQGSRSALVSARFRGVTLFTVRANIYRSDLSGKGRDGRCGFIATIPDDALNVARKRLPRDNNTTATLDFLVHPVVGSTVKRARLWRQLSLEECRHVFGQAGDAARHPPPRAANPYIGVIKRLDAKAISGWCATSYEAVQSARVPLSLYIDGLWVDTQVASTRPLTQAVGERISNRRGLRANGLRFRFRTPKWVCDGREHTVVVALAGHPEWGIDEPRTLLIERVHAEGDAFQMPALQVHGARVCDEATAPRPGEYEAWMRANRPRGTMADKAVGPLPAVTVLMEAFAGTDRALIDETLASLRARSVKAADVIVFGPASGHAQCTLADALEQVCTDHVVVCRAGDRVAARGIEILSARLAQADDAVLIFADDDVRDGTGRRRRPRFKTAYCPDRALTDTVFDGFTLVATARARAAMAGTPEPIDGRTLLLKVARAAGPERICHEPSIVCHRRLDPARLSAKLSPEQAAFIEALLTGEAAGKAASIRVKAGPFAHVRWPRRPRDLRLSAIIPTRDGAHLFEPLIDELLQDAARSKLSLEIVLLDHDSRSPVTHAAFARLREKGVRIVPYQGAFNFSAMCNAGAEAARGDILVFMNDDLVGLSHGLLDEMTRQVLRADVGAVGARLTYPNGTNQHCGLGLGLDGVAGHLLKGSVHLGHADHGRFRHAQTVSAVTAALMAVRRDEFDAVGGFDPGLSTHFNDVDLCLRLSRDRGLRTVYTPHARAYHLESQTRGYATSLEAQSRYVAQEALMRGRWGGQLETDPFISPHRTRLRAPAEPSNAAPMRVAAE